MAEPFSSSENEIIFSNNNNNVSEIDEELVSDRVHILANSIYQEFEMLIKKHGQGTVDGLMPSIVSMLETMDKLYTHKDELSLQLDLIKEDQSELYAHYDREKTCRRLAEEKNNRLEDQFEEERRHLEDRIELMESNNKLIEMRCRNLRDLISRHEDKEVELRKEFSNLQNRYSELLRSKADHKHRNLNSQGINEDSPSGRHSPVSVSKFKYEKIDKDNLITHSQSSPILTLDETDSAVGVVDMQNLENNNIMSLNEEMGEEMKPNTDLQYVSNEERNQDLAYFMNEEMYDNLSTAVENSNDEDDISTQGEFDDLVMGKEIEFLIKENQDLIETKIALNVVKDDLITKLDEMTGEICILREDLRSTTTLKKEYKCMAQDFEKKYNEVCDQLKMKESRLAELGESDNLIECSISENGVQTKTKFTRAEVARILHERNKYKEELLELQETLRYQTSILDKGQERSKKGTIWNLFSNVLSNATAFTAEALIGSGNEATVGQINRNFASNKSICYIQDEASGTSLQLPNLVQSSLNSRRNVTPGKAVRVSNPLLAELSSDSKPSSFDLVPVDSQTSELPRD